jgi:hypothetical protein
MDLSWRRIGAVALLVAPWSACAGSAAKKQIDPVYDQQTGRLQLLKYDSNGNGKPDTFSYMDGSRILRIEIDKNEDGKPERWEYYDAAQKLTRVGFSRSGDGKEDAWSYAAPDGSTARIEIATRQDGVVNRTEFYRQDALISAEEDTDADGVVDKWEAYEGAGEETRLASVAFDTRHRGRPDRRVTYDLDGGVRLEVDPGGDGRFVAP